MFDAERLLNAKDQVPLLSQDTAAVIDGVSRVHAFVTKQMQSQQWWGSHVPLLESRRMRFAAWASLASCLIHHFDEPA